MVSWYTEISVYYTCQSLHVSPLTGFDFDSVLRKKIKAPWIPKLSGPTDTSNFDPYEAEELRDPGPADYGNWDKDF